MYKSVELFNECDQSIIIQVTPGGGGVELFIKEDSKTYPSLYIGPNELPVIIKELEEMMVEALKQK